MNVSASKGIKEDKRRLEGGGGDCRIKVPSTEFIYEFYSFKKKKIKINFGRRKFGCILIYSQIGKENLASSHM